MRQALWLLALAGCQQLFNLRDLPADHDIGAPDAANDALPDADALPQLFVQGTVAAGSQTTALTAPLAPVTASGIELVIVTWTGLGDLASLTAADGRTFTPVHVTHSYAGGQLPIDIVVFYTRTTQGTPASSVGLSLTALADRVELRVLDYTGLDPDHPIDSFTFGTGTGFALDTGMLSTTQPRDLLVAVDVVTTTTAEYDPSFTLRTTATTSLDGAMDRVVTAPGAYHAIASQTTDAPWLFALYAFTLSK